ncbi:MAG: formylglycine-generating enzyme family protein [Nitrospinales bacterium]
MFKFLQYFILGLFLCTPAVSSEINSFPPSTVGDVTDDMVLIPAGTFDRGCDRFGLEHGAPAFKVYLNSFMIDKYEVTNKKFEEIISEHKLRRSTLSSCDDCPVSKVTWYEAADYCYLTGKWLPTEAQWEKAAGGVNGCGFPWGTELDKKNPQGRGGLQLKEKASPVGSYPPNKYGIYDMAGNLWEWVSDWYSPSYYMTELMYNPRGPSSGVMKVRRGGAWSDSVKAMRVGYRDWSYPFSRNFNDIGFRCVINLK